MLHSTRGAAALAIEAGDHVGGPEYPALLHRLLDPSRFPALAKTLEDGGFDRADEDPHAEFRSGLSQLLDGIAVVVAASGE